MSSLGGWGLAGLPWAAGVGAVSHATLPKCSDLREVETGSWRIHCYVRRIDPREGGSVLTPAPGYVLRAFCSECVESADCTATALAMSFPHSHSFFGGGQTTRPANRCRRTDCNSLEPRHMRLLATDLVHPLLPTNGLPAPNQRSRSPKLDGGEG